MKHLKLVTRLWFGHATFWLKTCSVSGGPIEPWAHYNWWPRRDLKTQLSDWKRDFVVVVPQSRELTATGDPDVFWTRNLLMQSPLLRCNLYEKPIEWLTDFQKRRIVRWCSTNWLLIDQKNEGRYITGNSQKHAWLPYYHLSKYLWLPFTALLHTISKMASDDYIQANSGNLPAVDALLLISFAWDLNFNSCGSLCNPPCCRCYHVTHIKLINNGVTARPCFPLQLLWTRVCIANWNAACDIYRNTFLQHCKAICKYKRLQKNILQVVCIP